jgi:hypothetical protein
VINAELERQYTYIGPGQWTQRVRTAKRHSPAAQIYRFDLQSVLMDDDGRVRWRLAYIPIAVAASRCRWR